MLIYNGKEMKNPYFASESRIIEINSPHSIEEAIEILRSGQELSAEEYSVNVFRIGEANVASGEVLWHPEILAQSTPIGQQSTGSYAAIVSPEVVASASDENAVYKRPIEFTEFEKHCFNLDTTWRFEPWQITNDELLKELTLSLGILPSLLDDPEDASLPLGKLRQISRPADHLIRIGKAFGPHGVISKDNPVPSKTACEAYASLSPYEKRVVDEGEIHPRKVLDTTMKTKQALMLSDNAKHSWILNVDFIEKVKSLIAENGAMSGPKLVEYFSDGIFKETPAKQLIPKFEESFKEIHKRAPKITPDYVLGKIALTGINSRASKEDIDKIVKTFDRQNIQKIAEYRSPVLFALDGLVDFRPLKDPVIELIGSELPLKKVKDFVDLKFPEWLAAHPNVKPSTLHDLITAVAKGTSMDPLDASLSEDATVSRMKNKRGYEDSKKFEQKYRRQDYKFENNELAIKGRGIIARHGNFTMRMLSKDDYANFTVGYDTNCCQHYGNAGESCVFKATSDPFAGTVVIERNGEVAAQGFVWTDEALDTFVFDNVEFASSFDNKAGFDQLKPIFAAYVNALPYGNVHVGVGYNQNMNGWGRQCAYQAQLPTTLYNGRITDWGNGNCYSDYHPDARAIKTNGRLERGVSISGNVSIENGPEEPTRWDALATPEMAFMLNDASKTPEERLDVARQFRENPTPELQMQVVQHFPSAILALENPCPEAQRYVLEHNSDLIEKIHNPIMEVQVALVEKDPSYLRLMENPPEDLVNATLARNGLMLEVINNPTDSNISTALSQNGYAWRFVPEALKTESHALEAVRTSPKAVALMDETVATPAVQEAAVTADEKVISLIKEPSEDAQITAVLRKPSLVLTLEDPSPNVVATAISRNGLLIRNFQKQYPELREVALRQNGFAIGCLHAPTAEEARIAILQNPAAISAIHDANIRSGFQAVYNGAPAQEAEEISVEM